MKKLSFLCFLLLASANLFAVPGDILSWANTGEGQVWGLDIREVGGDLELHMVAAGGQVYQFGATSLAGIHNGSEGGWDAKTAMFNPLVNINMRGLALVSTYEGPYGKKYVATQDNVTKYSSVWGDPLPVGSMDWIGLDGAWTTYAFDTDISPVSRTFTDDSDLDIWTVNSTDLGSGAVDAIYRYTNVPWKLNKDNYVTKFLMPKALKAVTIGANNDLWVLCTDKEVLNVSAVDGSILGGFYLDAAIDSPFGMTYSSLTDSLWLTNQSNSNIYQVAVPEPASMILLGVGSLVFIRRKKA